MTISPMYSVWCDADEHSQECSSWCAERSTRAEAWKDARSEGWVRVIQYPETTAKHYHPDCAPITPHTKENR